MRPNDRHPARLLAGRGVRRERIAKTTDPDVERPARKVTYVEGRYLDEHPEALDELIEATLAARREVRGAEPDGS